MSPSPRRSGRAAALPALLGLLVGAMTMPSPVAAHAIDGVFQLPVPLWLYLAGAATAVAASFVVTALLARRPAIGPGGYPVWPVTQGVAAAARVALRIVGLAWWYGAIAVGFVVGDISPLPAVLVWVGIWVGLPIVAAVLGNPWPSLSPLRTTFAGLEWIGRRLGAERLDAGLPYPAALARWPAVALLAAGIWVELILPGSSMAGTVAWVLVGYTVLTLIGMALFGQVAWLRNAELLEVELGWFGRIGPVGRRSRSPSLCDGCAEACDPERCVDCPECAAAADDRERGAVLRPWLVGLTDVDHARWSDAAFIVLALAGVSYDGMRETAFGAGLLGALLPPVQDVMGITGASFIVVETLAFALVVAAFIGAFVAVLLATRALGDHGRRVAVSRTAGVYAATLLPIAAGYVIAHYLTLVIRGVLWLPSLLADPLMSLAPDMGWVPAAFVWYLSVGAIVAGHVAAIVLAHRLALRDAPSRPVIAGLPMVALMVAYTILSLWIIAQPIVVDPGVTPPSALR